MRGKKTINIVKLGAGTLALLVGVSTTAMADQAGTETSQVAAPEAVVAVQSATAAQAISTDWVVKTADNVCGVSTSRQITNPAKVNFDTLMSATSEMKELKREKIDKTSARGQALVTKATEKVREAAKAVMSDKGHCSVWKKISHKQNKAIVDLTDAIKPKLK